MSAYGGSTYGGSAYMPVVAQSSFAGTMPAQVITEIAFASNPLDDATAVWTDVSLYVQSIQTQRGRQHELQVFNAGTATVTLDNKDGRFSPFNTSSPYNPNVLPYKQLRIRALYNGVYYPIFRGHINSWPVKWPSPADSTVTVQATDGFKLLNLKKATTLSPYSSTILADSPSVYFRMGDAPGATVALDSSGNLRNTPRNDTTPGGGVAAPQPNSFLSPTFGAAGALQADPDTAWDTGGYSGSINYVPNFTFSGTGPFSIECWIKLRSLYECVFFLLGDSGLAHQIQFVANFTGTVGTLSVNLQGSVSSTTTSTSLVNDSKWHHVVATVNAAGTTVTIYVDGAQDTVKTVSASTFSNLVNMAWGAQAMDGLIDEAAFYTSALTPTQVAAHYAAGATPRKGELSGARVGAYLDAVGWPLTLRKVDAGLITLQAVSNDSLNNSALANLQVVADTELGDLFVGADGSVVFYDHNHKYKTPNGLTALTLGDSGTLGPGGESPYILDSVDIEFDDLDLYNQASVTPSGQGAQLASDSASQTAYGPRLTSKSGIQNLNSDALNEANFLVGKYKTPLQRIRSVTFTPMSDPTVLLPAAMGFELLTRVTVKRRPKDGAGSTFSQDSLIEGISHTIVPGMWTTTYALSPTDAAPVPWIIDDPVAGKVVDGASQSPPVVIGF